MPENSNPKIDYDVAIVGAGPVGLATALGLYQRGIENIIVLDQTRAFRKVGQGLDLLPNGLKAIKYTHTQAYENIKETGNKLNNPTQPNQETKAQKNQSAPRWVTRNVNGEEIRSFSLEYDEWFHKYGEGRVSISWYDLQTQLRTLLPEEVVKANHRCINVVAEPELKCVRADFISNQEVETNPYAHWDDQQEKNKSSSVNSSQFPESEITSIRTKLLIAADGINSTVRQVIYKETPYSEYSKPEYSGVVAIGSGGVYEIPEALSQKIQDLFIQGSRIVTILNQQIAENSTENQTPRIILFSRQSGQCGYLIHTPLTLELLAGKSGKELIDLAILELKKANFPEMIQQLVALSSPEKIIQRPYYIHPVNIPAPNQPKWNMGRVVLAGDAAHGMPPFMGQGANQGLEDAAVITTLVTEIDKQNKWDDLVAIETAFSKYEGLRRPLMERIQYATLTRLPLSSEQYGQEYAQQVYARNIDQIMQTLLS
ncbi:MAG: FAD-dependent monooxygenase [Okeania sp. SIO3I5]|uniref:FAD-dependent oxidoreductase n=1 Tax=Okeania sp. SIO3I5 TaxID=2607805 RepID=UPI0013BB7A8B|nr:NAD(P)/FAD-dependent oxidoreductase [Okeania sp. SIO3I5]NEQ35820.1 FAD-dependent monooxygenase [Okeania sp. SIO3I5]